ncbi:DUF2865 domain-containing protein [Lichenihabitans sp. Uapishka_5]|uniref:DUF2865 domain-containing protein n=1 Tax=Lichenihabitans sp. Uapishka_5 TaxID=3037302 RepID=UPI0029E7CFC1|nr:DUF2865 domain-containing protein [Lichenihabitans sp. Uapishka_5]MDX7952224.1 DUF2865 domain-containing protein [Lichenihabitans sp. Uapishka_5]
MRPMVSVFRFLRSLPVALVGAGLLGAGLVGPATAQGDDCESLRQQMAASMQSDPTREGRFARAIEQQRTELARTQAYGDQLGCGGLNLFGAPAQCDTIETRIARQQSNLDSLEQQAKQIRNGDPDRMNDLAARYDRFCRTAQDDGTTVYADPGLIDGNGNPAITDDGADKRPQGGAKAICVRTCDGGFFPLGTTVRNEALDSLQALCSAQCPNTEAKLYTTADTDNISNAVGLDGTPYTALPAAFKFQKVHEASCTCKPPNQTWVQALAKAEEMLDKTDAHDMVVTEKMSADMARPTQPVPPATKKPARRKTSLDGPAAPPR